MSILTTEIPPSFTPSCALHQPRILLPSSSSSYPEIINVGLFFHSFLSHLLLFLIPPPSISHYYCWKHNPLLFLNKDGNICAVYMHVSPCCCVCFLSADANAACNVTVYICMNMYRCTCLHLFVYCRPLSQVLSSRLCTVYLYTEHVVEKPLAAAHTSGDQSLTPIMQKWWELVAKPDIIIELLFLLCIICSLRPCIMFVHKGMRICEHTVKSMVFSLD